MCTFNKEVMFVMKLSCTWNDEVMFVFSNEVVFVLTTKRSCLYRSCLALGMMRSCLYLVMMLCLYLQQRGHVCTEVVLHLE